MSFGLHLQKIWSSGFNRKVLPLIIWFDHILLNNDVSLHNLVVLVVTIPTSPRLSKTEFVCESYCDVTLGRFLKREKKKGEGGSGQTGLQSGPGRVPGRRCRVGLRHPGRPRPDTRPARSGKAPVPRPAQAGPQAGAAGWAAGSRAGPGRVAGRPPPPGALLLRQPACWPAQAGSQAGSAVLCCLSFSFSLFLLTAPFLEPLFKGLLLQK